MSGATPPAAMITDHAMAQVMSQLQAIQQAITSQSQINNLQNQAMATRLDDMRAMFDQRLDDMQTHLDGRLNSHEDRITRVESNERASAVRSAAAGGISGAVTTLAAEIIKMAIRP